MQSQRREGGRRDGISAARAAALAECGAARRAARVPARTRLLAVRPPAALHGAALRLLRGHRRGDLPGEKQHDQRADGSPCMAGEPRAHRIDGETISQVFGVCESIRLAATAVRQRASAVPAAAWPVRAMRAKALRAWSYRRGIQGLVVFRRRVEAAGMYGRRPARESESPTPPPAARTPGSRPPWRRLRSEPSAAIATAPRQRSSRCIPWS